MLRTTRTTFGGDFETPPTTSTFMRQRITRAAAGRCYTLNPYGAEYRSNYFPRRISSSNPQAVAR